VPLLSAEYRGLQCAQNGVLSALVWTKFWTKPPQPYDLNPNRIPPGSFYLIVDELDGRGMNSVSPTHSCTTSQDSDPMKRVTVGNGLHLV
jgi:hypothetical protein